MKFELKTIRAIPSRVTTQIQIRKMTLKSRQKGASALEYLVLAAALVLIIGAALGTGLGEQVTQAFADLFTDAADGGE